MMYLDEQLNPRQVLEQRAVNLDDAAIENDQKAERLEREAARARKQAQACRDEAEGLRVAGARLNEMEPYVDVGSIAAAA